MDLGIRNYNYNYNYDNYSMNGTNKINNSDASTDSVQKSAKSEVCQTCKNRTYIDGSNEGNVSFKSPGHIDPGASAALVSAHEGEHVANAVQEGSKEGNQLLSASVSLQTSICPECGRAYVSGGVTRTTIKYNETNPYEQSRKTLEGSFLRGQNIDLAA